MSSPEKTAVLHVGAHKTGTSVLQRYLDENEQLLLQHNVMHVSRTEMSRHIGWGMGLVSKPESMADTIAELHRNPSFRMLIGSNENTVGRPFVPGCAHLYPQSPEIVDALGGILRTCRPKIFLSIRPQHEFLESYYLQTIQQGGQQTFQAWLEGIDLDSLSWLPLATKLFGTFGRENVHIVDFRLIKRGQGVYLQHFFTRIDLGFSIDVQYDATHNRSISDKGLQMALAANGYLTSADERRVMRKFLQRHFSNLHYPRPVLLSDEQRRSLRDRYSAEYEQLVGCALTADDRRDDAVDAVER